MKVVRVSSLTQERHEREIAVTEAEMTKWKSGISIHEAFPNLSDDDKEFIMTGITEEEWHLLGPHPY